MNRIFCPLGDVQDNNKTKKKKCKTKKIYVLTKRKAEKNAKLESNPKKEGKDDAKKQKKKSKSKKKTKFSSKFNTDFMKKLNTDLKSEISSGQCY